MSGLRDLDGYLARIGLDGRPDLASIHRAHATSIPFENLDPATGVAVLIDPDQLEAKLVTRRRVATASSRIFYSRLHWNR